MIPTGTASAITTVPEGSELANTKDHQNRWAQQTVISFRQLTPLVHYTITAPFGNLLRDAHTAYIVLFERIVGSATSLTMELEKALASLRLYRIEIPAALEVRDYLLRFPRLGLVIPSIARIVREKVGPETQLSLEIYRDPEIQDEYLVLMARRPGYEPEFLQTLDELSSQAADILPVESGWLVITTDFRSPLE